MADINETLNNLNDTPDTTGEYDPADIEQNKVFAILAYLSILVLVPILGAKESKFARFHANQGLVLVIAAIAIGIVIGILQFIPVLGIIFSIVGWIINIALLVLCIIGIVNACNGKAKELPLIGSIKILK